MRRFSELVRGVADARGRLPVQSGDHDEAHRAYVSKLPEFSQGYLVTKPFCPPPFVEMQETFRSFCSLVDSVHLELRSQVLDVGCGPGWLSEYLARCGAWVVGTDIAPAMLALAERRLGLLPRGIPGQPDPLAEFIAVKTLDIPWKRRFDLIVIFASLHHFDREVETLSVLREALAPGGSLYVHEAVRPPRGSPYEKTYLTEMAERGTYESPFSPRYLRRCFEDAGFTDVRRLAPIDRVFPHRSVAKAFRHAIGRVVFPLTNTFVATKPRAADHDWHADARLAGAGDGPRSEILLRNTGNRYWPSCDTTGLPPTGTVRVVPGVRVAGRTVPLDPIPLPQGVATGDEVKIALPKSATEITLLRHGIAEIATLVL